MCSYTFRCTTHLHQGELTCPLLKTTYCYTAIIYFFHSCTVHFDVIKSFICPTNAQLNCFKMLKFTIRFAINAPTWFGLTRLSCRLPDDGLVKPKHVGAFIVNLNVNFKILKQLCISWANKRFDSYYLWLIMNHELLQKVQLCSY